MMEKKSVKRRAIRVMVCSLALFFMLVSCDQDPIFYKIYQEVKPLEPRIKGVPTNFVEFKGGIYVASDSLYRYKKNDAGKAGWKKPRQPPGGNVRALAATTKWLYVHANNGKLYRSGDAENWSEVTVPSVIGYSALQTIYGAGDTLFGSLWNKADNEDQNDKHAIFYIRDDGTRGKAKTETARLSGAVQSSGGAYYLATNGDGVYYLPTLTGPVQLANSANSEDKKRSIMGLIEVGSDVIAAARNGDILRVDSSNFTVLSTDNPRMTGAMALWRGPAADAAQLLLLGIQPDNGSISIRYGYREIVLDGSGNLQINGDKLAVGLQKPGTGAPSSVSDEDRYDITIGSRPVNHLFQAPFAIDAEMTLFAAVQGTGKSNNEVDSGVWSYRNRNPWQWNAEE